MGTLGEPTSSGANGVGAAPPLYEKTDESDEGAVGEPLLQEGHQAHLDLDVFSGEPPQTPPSATGADFHPLKSHPVLSSSDDESAPAPPDFTPRGIHIPTRTSSSGKTSARRKYPRSFSTPTQSIRSRSIPTTPRSYSRTVSSAASIASYDTGTTHSSSATLSPLQQKGLPDEVARLSPLLEDDPRSFDLVAPDDREASHGTFSLETRAEELFSSEHLEAIFQDTPSLLRFTSFLSQSRPESVPILIYYLDALKALRAINYANAVAEALEPLEGYEFTHNPARPTVNAVLEDKARQAFEVLVRNDLPAFVTHIFIQVVSVSIQKRITGTLSPLLREASEGLAEVFCVTDPSRTDNPIIFASEEFHRTTQYGVSSAIGRNCRFLQGPRTNPHTVARLERAVREGKEISELIMNYRRDGSPFMNLLMVAPLLDSHGHLRYCLGAQVDVSGLVKDNTDLDAFQRVLDKREGKESDDEAKDEFQELSEMFNNAELDTVRKFGGRMHRENLEEDDDASVYHRPRLLIRDPNSKDGSEGTPSPPKPESRISSVYKYYLLVRPAPSLRILFTSPSLRVPGVLQSRFLDRVGGSSRVRDSLAQALADGSRGVTAKIRWLSVAAADPDSESVEEGRPRWIHCTPLLGASGSVGVWMVVLVDDEKSPGPVRRFRAAPPVASDFQMLERAGSPRGSPRDASSDDDEFDGRPNRYSLRINRRSGVGSLRRPLSAVSDQRAVRSGSPMTESSIYSFALV